MSFLSYVLAMHGIHDLSSLARDRTHAPAVELRYLNHWTTREVLIFNFKRLNWLTLQLPLPSPLSIHYVNSRELKLTPNHKTHQRANKRSKVPALVTSPSPSLLAREDTNFPGYLPAKEHGWTYKDPGNLIIEWPPAAYRPPAVTPRDWKTVIWN